MSITELSVWSVLASLRDHDTQCLSGSCLLAPLAHLPLRLALYITPNAPLHTQRGDDPQVEDHLQCLKFQILLWSRCTRGFPSFVRFIIGDRESVTALYAIQPGWWYTVRPNQDAGGGGFVFILPFCSPIVVQF